MEDALSKVKEAVEAGRTDILNTVLENSVKLGSEGIALREKILKENVVSEGTFLHLAAKLSLQDVTRALLMAGADPTVENKHGENPFELTSSSEVLQQVYVEELLRATANSDLRRMDQLIKAGVDPNSWDCEEKRNSVLHWAVSFGTIDSISYLIDKGANVNSETSEGVTPLHDAVDRGDPALVRLLLDNNASPLLKAEKGKFEGQSPLDLASQKPEIFSIMSQFLAAQFKNTQSQYKRSISMDSISIGPESPIYVKENGQSSSDRDKNGPSFSECLGSGTGFNNNLEGAIRDLELTAPIQPIITDTKLSLLWPQPKSLQQLEGLHFRPEKILRLSVLKTCEPVHKILDIFSVHKEEFDELGFDIVAEKVEGNFFGHESQIPSDHSSQIQCCVNPNVLPNPGSYRLHVCSQMVKIMAADLDGFNYGVCSLLQLLTLYSTDTEEPIGIPSLVINDHPSLKHRAILLDISQERVPTIEQLFEMIRIFALLKINFLHLHMRVDLNGTYGPYTKSEIVAIDRNCQDYRITLVPAIDITSGISASDYVKHIKPVFLDVLPCFASSKHIHIGPQLTSFIFMSKNLESSHGFEYGTLCDFLPLLTSEHVVFVCYNALKTQIVNLARLPHNVISVPYGFQADYNFGPNLLELTQNGCATCVCVGTSAWSSLAGCPEASLCNVYHGTMNAVSNGSLGLIVANWSGSCNLTSKVFAFPGFLLGSGLSWNHQTHWEYLQGSLANLISFYALQDKSGVSGQVVLQLGCTETNLLRKANDMCATDVKNLPPPEGSTMYRFLIDPDTVFLDHLNLESIIKAIRSIKKCQTALLVESKMQREGNPIFEELCLSMELLLLSCKIGRSLLASGMNPRSNMGLSVVNLGIANLPPTIRTDIANKLLTLIEEYRRIWLLQNMSQGLEISLFSLTTVMQRFIPDSTRMMTGRLVPISPRTSVSSIPEHSPLMNGNP